MIFAASILIKLGAKNVFIKGGHLESKIRVMGESDNSKLLQKCWKIILKKIK